jgi:hypothetical protein
LYRTLHLLQAKGKLTVETEFFWDVTLFVERAVLDVSKGRIAIIFRVTQF